ncbi:uncharacterized protein ACLA_039170 [Aspergillus clavatus NRRL 1]|uniref:Uncharacterized protein n=1 Tax=Aspergillus clavatus (strain ATCC 1007 / CBS 513.65 / DSM 816 / NCTC 3887 / NRRL 1 / QM 1276 / 107) TaxID=344612 RepID=A1CKM8_ASPCL|nr:uncharacterized protein ACLA_039170 [Aspergillus clavatus NRRL 1]EAW09702.1 conserved hypothetical protein [Aspergillus clavatus NRRL 1]
MAKRSPEWKAKQEEKRRQDRRERRQQRGYNPEDHRQEDSQRTRKRASRKQREVSKGYVRKYEEFLQEEKGLPNDYKVGEGHPVPTLEELKEFIRWWISSTKGKIAPNGRPTRDSILNGAHNFVPGFFLATGNEIPSNDASELYSFIGNDLVDDGYISAIKKPRYNFQLKSFERAIVAFWGTDDAFFMPGRYRVQFHFITLQFLCSAARVSALTPASEDKFERGLRYKMSPQMILEELDGDLTNGALYILALALADGALWGFTYPEEVFEQRIPEGENELVLSWKDEARDRCIVRSVTAKGVSEDPLVKEKYQSDLRKILTWISFFITATVHAMRRKLGKAVAGYKQYHENGLPHQLPMEEEQKINKHPDLVTKDREIKNARSPDDIKKLQQDRSVIRRKLYSKALQDYHTLWVQGRRDWKILT